MIKKIISLALTIIMTLGCVALTASAAVVEDSTVSPMSLYTSNVTSNLTISSKTATCKSIVSGKSAVTKIVITQRLQKKSGDSWTNVQSWTKTTNSGYSSFMNTKSSLASGTYRVRTIAKVYSGTAYETTRVNSSTCTIWNESINTTQNKKVYKQKIFWKGDSNKLDSLRNK